MADAVAAFLERQACDVVVLDPVMVATSGDRLLADDAVEAVRRLLPLASVVTPNLAEAATLLQEPVATSVEEMVAQAHRLRAAGALRVLLKGGHLPGGDEAVDVLVGPDGVQLLAGPRIDTTNTHGTGCSLSSAPGRPAPAAPGLGGDRAGRQDLADRRPRRRGQPRDRPGPRPGAPLPRALEHPVTSSDGPWCRPHAPTPDRTHRNARNRPSGVRIRDGTSGGWRSAGVGGAVRVARYEWMFWDAAWRRESWPV